MTDFKPIFQQCLRDLVRYNGKSRYATVIQAKEQQNPICSICNGTSRKCYYEDVDLYDNYALGEQIYYCIPCSRDFEQEDFFPGDEELPKYFDEDFIEDEHPMCRFVY